jgi:hypothetical protein
MPKEVEIALRLAPGQSWKSRFVSTSEVTWTLKGADGKEQAKTRAVGLELIATQTVASLSGGTARIEVNETAARILRDGKFFDAPFRQFGPPNPVAFTLDTGTGKTDFTEMEKAYADWMAGVKAGPAGEILGKSFRLDAYVAQLKEIYGKPYTRSAESPEESRDHHEGLFSVLGWRYRGSLHVVRRMRRGKEELLKVAGKYGGRRAVAEAASQLEFGVAAPKEFRRRRRGGLFNSSVDVMAGREIRATSQLRYSTSASIGGASITQEIAGKSLLEPAD